ncbi:MAG TPA: hypothetical protein VK175_03030 [Leadbetterella sp.]|nr:hypothetical protein [Leadbetterella sp.]
MMKFKSVLMCVLGLVSMNAIAQTEMQTLFDKSKNKIQSLGFYIAPEISFGQIGGSFAPIAGNSLMLTLNKKFAVGASLSGSVRDNGSTNMSGHFGGLKIEYTPKPDALVHVSFPLLIGAGSTFTKGSFEGFDRRGRYNDRFDFDRNESFVLQPGVNVEANVFKYAKVFLGVNYRLSANKSGYDADLSGFSSSLGLKFGVFDYKLKKKDKASAEPTEEAK